MESIHLNEVSEIIHWMVLFPKKTIRFISSRADISRDVVRQVLLYLYEYPFGGISIYYEGIPASMDLFSMDCDILDDTALWSIDIGRMDHIPVENLNSSESYILFGLLNGLSVIDQDDMALKSHHNSRNLCIMTKGMDRDTGKLFDFSLYPIIKKALTDRLSLIVITREESENKTTVLKPLGVVYQSEEDKWYLMSFDADERVMAYDIDDMQNVHLGGKFSVPKQFDLKSSLQAYFSLEHDNKEEYVEVIFLGEANVSEKAQRRLHGKGSFRPMEDDALLFTGKIIGMKGFKDWLLGFGSSAIVMKPEALRQEIISELLGVAANYGMISEQVSAASEEQLPN